MTIESFGLLEHFDYLKNYVPQPFYISESSLKEFRKLDDEYLIITDKFEYSLTSSSAKKLVDSLGIKIKLFNSDDNKETDVVEQVIPAINKLLKCFIDCFVFYTASDDPLTIIDLNINMSAGAEGTKYEHGPSPWKIDLKSDPTVFTCFVNFLSRYELETLNDVKVKADDPMPNGQQVLLSLFKPVNNALQPMLTFSSKFSNMKGFTDIHPVVLDTSTDIMITFPMNYAKSEEPDSFENMWRKTEHIFNSINMNDFIFGEANELASSKETPGNVKSFISHILVDSLININQPLGLILNEANNKAATMKPGKAKKFKQNIGLLIGWCLCRKHSSCHECGHIEL